MKLFQGKGRCATCHHGPLFTDQDYHNIGIMKRDEIPLGRFAHAPVGQKESRLMGAFRTPTLRNLPRTGPYFHDGSRPELRDVVKYYNDALIHNRHLAKVFVGEEDQAVSLGLTVEEVETLVLFLRSLEGEPLDAVVARSK